MSASGSRLVVLDEYQDTGVAQRVLLSRAVRRRASRHGGGGSEPGDLRLARRVGEQPLALRRALRPGRPMASAAAVDDQLPLQRTDPRSRPTRSPRRCRLARRKGRPTHRYPEAAPDRWPRRGRRRGRRAARDRDRRGAVARRQDRAPHSTTAAAPKRSPSSPGGGPTSRGCIARWSTLDLPVEVVGLGGLLAMPEVSDIVAVLALLADSTANAAAVRSADRPAMAARCPRPRRARSPGRVGSPETDRPRRGDELVEPMSTSRRRAGRAGGPRRGAAARHRSVDPVEVPSLLEAVEDRRAGVALLAGGARAAGPFARRDPRLRGLVGQPLVDLITEIVTTTGLDVEIEAGDAPLAEARMANVHAFLDVAAQFTGLDGEGDLAAFLAYLRAAPTTRTVSTSARCPTPTPSS